MLSRQNSWTISAQCSQPSSPSVFGGGRDGLRLIVGLFGGARTDCAREGEDRTDYRGRGTIGHYSPSAWTSCASQAEIIHRQTNSFHIMRHHSCHPPRSPVVPHHPGMSSRIPGRPPPSPAIPSHPSALFRLRRRNDPRGRSTAKRDTASDEW